MPKMRLLSTALKFLCLILYAFLMEFCSLNFAIARRYLLRGVTFQTIISKFTEEIDGELRKIDT